MQARKETSKSAEYSSRINEIAINLLPIIARKKALKNLPVNAGNSFFYDLEMGWETDLLEKDCDVCRVNRLSELEQAFKDPLIKTIFIPYKAHISRDFALRVCKRQGQAKTVFFEFKSKK